MPEPVIIVDYNPQWPVMYEEEKARILSAIGLKIVAIEHIGSTSVPGLGAKPIIDIMVGVRQLAEAEECIEPLQSVGYEFVPPEKAGIPERRYFRKREPGARTHHLHMVEMDSEFWEKHLLFRDCLRANHSTAEQYHVLKKRLAEQYGLNREGYTEAKTLFIQSVLAKARAEH
ncbi:MAG: GrpB family protein [Dehalococcoidales bacterium]|nr:MAG: GrpB family protein [Dehalococcoidales bacterium]